jgi:hypothetical protein
MVAQRDKEIRRFIILPVDVTEDRQIIHIDRKLPAHLFRCKGFLLSVKNCINTLSDIPHLGEISLLLNSGQVHPFHHMADYKRKVLSRKNSFVEIDEELIPNLMVNGFYRDLGNARDHNGNFIPYSLNIYLDCLATE